MAELTMLSRTSKYWRWVHSLLSSQPSILFSFVHLLCFAIFLLLHTSFCTRRKCHLWFFNFLFPDGFYLVFLDFCLVVFPFYTPDSYSSEATWQLIAVCSAIYIYTSYCWITYMYTLSLFPHFRHFRLTFYSVLPDICPYMFLFLPHSFSSIIAIFS